LSSTFRPANGNYSEGYGSGSLAGIYGTDTVDVGALTLENYTFAVVNSLSGVPHWTSVMSGYDGILGLGRPSGRVGPYPTVLQVMMESGQLAEPVFGFYLGSEAAAGEIVFGGVDPEHVVGDFTFVDLFEGSLWPYSSGKWAFRLDGVKVGGPTLASNSSRVAIVDSGSSLLSGPREEVESVASMLGAIFVHDAGLYAVLCNSTAGNLAFAIGGRDFVLTTNDLTLARAEGFCFLGLQAGNILQTQWVFGDVFMRSFYVQFDYGRKRIGLALAASAAAARNTTLV
jgi:hypothetical protein